MLLVMNGVVALLILLILIGTIFLHYTKNKVETFTVSNYLIPIYISNVFGQFVDITATTFPTWQDTFSVLRLYRIATNAESSLYQAANIYTNNSDITSAKNSNKIFYIVGPQYLDPANRLTKNQTVSGNRGSQTVVQCGDAVLLPTTLQTQPGSLPASLPIIQPPSSPNNQAPPNRNNPANVQLQTVFDPCTGLSQSRQSSYASNFCSIYRNMVKPILDDNIGTPVLYNKIVNAYKDNIELNLMNASKMNFTAKYEDILNAVIVYEKVVYGLLIDNQKPLPANYTFTVPEVISVIDYLPGIATWDAASTSPKSYKCVEFSAAESTIIQKIANRPVRTGGGDLIKLAKKNACLSKGYNVDDGSFGAKGCSNCEGCCMPSDDTPPSGSASNPLANCPRPKLRKFQIAPRQIRLQLVAPNLKKGVECFSNQMMRDIQQIYKSEKFANLQML